jgi:hypothetical protein
MTRQDGDIPQHNSGGDGLHERSADATSAGSDRRELERLVDDLLDGELPRERSRAIFERLCDEPEAARELASTQRAIDALAEPVQTPDFVSGVIDEVQRRRGFVSARGRQRLWATRAAIAASIAMLAGAGFMVQRHWPGIGGTDRAEPMTALAAGVSSDMQAAVDSASSRVAEAPERLLDRAQRAMRGPSAQPGASLRAATNTGESHATVFTAEAAASERLARLERLRAFAHSGSDAVVAMRSADEGAAYGRSGGANSTDLWRSAWVVDTSEIALRVPTPVEISPKHPSIIETDATRWLTRSLADGRTVIELRGACGSEIMVSPAVMVRSIEGFGEWVPDVVHDARRLAGFRFGAERVGGVVLPVARGASVGELGDHAFPAGAEASTVPLGRPANGFTSGVLGFEWLDPDWRSDRESLGR